MSFSPDVLLAELRRLERLPLAIELPPRRYTVAFSGGLDSSALLHALVAARPGPAIVAVHVDHGMHPDSKRWADQCRTFCDALGIALSVRAVSVSETGGAGPEAAARAARYRALAEMCEAGDWLLSAHHLDDQAETLLINILRGSGPAGTAAMPGLRPFAGGLLARPLLAIERQDLERYARAAAFAWVDDPSNDTSQYDRNFLRKEVLPLLQTRFPGAGRGLARSAALAGEARAVLTEVAEEDLSRAGGCADRLSLDVLQALPRARLKNLLRHAVAHCGLPTPGSVHVDAIVDELIFARADAAPLVRWSGAEVRRFGERVYLMPALPAADFDGAPFRDVCDLGPGMGRLRLEPGPGLSLECVKHGLTLRRRIGGEKIRLASQTHTRKLKKLLQEEGIVPWMRDRLPLLYSDERLVAVADIWVDASAAAETGMRVCWQDRPALH